MADNWQKFVVEVDLQTTKALDKIKELQKANDDLARKRDDLAKSGGSKTALDNLNKQIEKNQKQIDKLQRQTHSFMDTLNNLDTASLDDLRAAQRALNNELNKVPQTAEHYHELNERLQQVKTKIAEIRDQSRQNYEEQKQLNEEMAAMQRVLSNIDTSSLKELSLAESALKKQMQEAAPNTDAYQKAAAGLRAVQSRIRSLNEEQKETVRIIDQYDKEIKVSSKDLNTTRREADLINKTLGNLNKSNVRDIEYSIKILNEQLRETGQGTAEFKEINNQLTRLKSKLRDINDESKETTNLWKRVVNIFNVNWGFFTQAIASITGLSASVRVCVKAYAGMKEAMADTRKYTGLSTEGVEELNEAFKKMDTRTAREDLNALAGAAGRLSITSQKGIQDFTDAANMIKVSLGDDLGKGAIDNVGKLAMAFGEDDRMGLRGAMLATGSAINELAQNSSANAGYLVDFTARIAGVGKQLGMTQAQLMGFGAVMDENLLQDEMSSTAFSQLLTKMATDTKTFAKMAGMDVEKFAKLVKTDMNDAVLTLLHNLSSADFENLGKMFNDMGLDGTRAVSVLSTMVNKLDDIRDRQKLATQAYKDGTSVVEEYNTMNTTVQAELDKAKNHFHELAVELGGRLVPVAKYTISAGSLLIKTMSVTVNFIMKNRKALVVLTSAITAYIIALNHATISEKLHNAVKAISNALTKVGNVLKAAEAAAATAVGIAYKYMTGEITAATAAQQLLNKVILANPYVAAAAAVAGLTAMLVALASKSDDATQAQKDLSEANQQAKVDASEETTELNALVDAARDKTQSDVARQEAIKQLQDKYPDYLSNLNLENINSTNAANAVANLTKQLLAQAQARVYLAKIEELERKKMDVDEDYLDSFWGRLKHQVAAVGEGFANWMAHYSEKIGNSVSSFFNSGNHTLHDLKDGWDKKTYIEENGYGLTPGQVLQNNWTGDRKALEQEQIKFQNLYLQKEKEIQQTTADLKEANEQLANTGKDKNGTTTGNGVNGSTYQSDKEKKGEERAKAAEVRKAKALERLKAAEDRKAEAAKKQDYEDEIKAEKAHLDTLLLNDYLYFTQDSHNLQQFRAQELKDRMDSLDEQIRITKKYNGEDANEAAELMRKKQQLQEDYNQETYKLREEDIAHAETMAKIKVQQLYKTEGSEIFNDEGAMQQRISEIELSAFEHRMQLMKEQGLEGSADYLRMQNEYEEKQSQAKLDSELYYQNKLDQYRQQWGQMSNKQQMDIAIKGLDNLHNRGLMKEEEYQRMKAHIQAQYAQNPTEQRNEQFDTKVNDMVSTAKAGATGGYDKTKAFSISNNPLVGQVNEYRTTMEQLRMLYGKDKDNYAAYQAAKRQVTSEFLQNMVATTQAAYDSINNLMSAASSYSQACSDLETAKISANYQKQIDAAGNNSKKKERLEKKRDKELAAAKTKANKKAMKIEIAQALASTALAAINSYASASKINWILGPIAAAMAVAAGMLQIATIKKQHQAEEAGYYEGGFTGGHQYHRKAGIVHEGEFVANHAAVNNPQLLPALQLIDLAQRNNTVGRLTATDVSRTLGTGTATVVSAPTVNVSTDNSELRSTIDNLNVVVDALQARLTAGIEAHVDVVQTEKALNHLKVLKGNTK